MKKALILLGFILSLQVSAQTQIRQMEGVTEYRLDNGLQVLLAPNNSQPRVYANLVIKAGSAVEGLGEGGMAHLLEHMLFKGTPAVRDPTKTFAERSLSFNGATTVDSTKYFAAMSPGTENLNWYLGWLADASMNSYIAKEDLDKEMTVVRNEFERAGGSSDRAVYDRRMALAFPSHGYGHSTLGNRSDIENVDIARLQAFYKIWYRPSNMVLVVSGKFEESATLAHIAKVFGPLKNPAQPLPTVYTREPVQDGVREATVRRVGADINVRIGWRGAPRASRDDAVLAVIANALANSAGGRFKTDIEQQALGTQIWAAHTSMLHYGLFDVGLRVADLAKLDMTQTLLLTHIADIAKFGVTQEELGRAQVVAQTNSEVAKHSAEGFGGLLAESAAAGDWRLAFWYAEKVKEVTIEDTKRAAREYLVDANRVRVTFIPEPNSIRATDPLPLDLKDYVAQPSAASTSKAALPFVPLAQFEPTFAEIDKRTVRIHLKGGTRLALLARPAAGDVMRGTLRIHWGNLESMRGWGYAPYFAGLLLKGTTTRSEEQIKDELTRLQSGLSINTGTGGMTIGFSTTRQNWHAFAGLMQDVIRNPKFDEGKFKTWQQEVVAHATKALDSPEAQADNALRRAMAPAYEVDDPRYQPTQKESLARWQALKLDDIKRFWAQFAGASVAEFAAAGALDVDIVKADVARLLDDWQTPGGVESYRHISAQAFLHAGQRIQVATPDKPNALMSGAYRFSLEPWSRESTAMTIANALVGGSSASRLYTKVRKEEGLSYGVASYLHISEEDKLAIFGINGTFAPQSKAKFETTVSSVLDDIRAKGLSSVELFFAKRVAADRIKQGLASDGYIANEMATALYKERSGEVRNAAWYEAKAAMLQSLTIEEVDAAVRKLLDTTRLVTVMAGDFKTASPP
ncbi:MAG: insulinase family protein [Cytophagales bacterium]|nr:insulinase family protein [Cytophagales bacterium]